MKRFLQHLGRAQRTVATLFLALGLLASTGVISLNVLLVSMAATVVVVAIELVIITGGRRA